MLNGRQKNDFTLAIPVFLEKLVLSSLRAFHSIQFMMIDNCVKTSTAKSPKRGPNLEIMRLHTDQIMKYIFPEALLQQRYI